MISQTTPGMVGGTLEVPGGLTILRSGFLPANLGEHGLAVGSTSPVQRMSAVPDLTPEARAALDGLKRGEIVGDIPQVLFHLGTSLEQFRSQIQRDITSTMTAFPVRENLEAEAKILIPIDTPLRNRLPRIPGAGKASAWKQLTSLGGGWGSGVDEGGGGTSASQVFFGESGAPATLSSVYADKSATYKLMGSIGKVTGFAMAAGANFQAQLSTERANQIKNLMLNEENALFNGDATATAAPWGDGTNALAFNGLINLATTANGTPAAQVQVAVGPLTTLHIDTQLRRLFNQGAQGMWMAMNGQEILSLVHLAESSGTIIRVMAAASDPQGVLGFYVNGYRHPVTGEIVPILPSRFLAAGTIVYACDRLPDGTPALDVDVLPQIELPQLAPNENVQGYVAQELAPTMTAPQVYAFLVSVYEVLRMKSALHVAKSSGVTAV